MKYRYTVRLSVGDERIYFKYDSYDDVQNLIGYMVDGTNVLDISIFKEAINE